MAALAACAVLAASTASASSPIGTMSAELDGEQREWQTLSVPSEGTATAEFRDLGGPMTISIQGLDPDAANILHGTFSIETTLMGSGAGASSFGASMSYFPEGMSGAFYTSAEEDQTLSLQFSALDVTSDPGKAEGTFSGRMCRLDNFSSPMDMDDCIEVEGRFATELHKGQ